MQLFKVFVSLFLKSQCPLCQRSAADIFCQSCQRQVGRYQLANPSQFWLEEIPIFVWGEYAGLLKRAIGALKYENHPQVAKPMGRWLAEAWLNSQEFTIDKLTVVPIPLHAEKLKRRGFNQAELVAESFCQVTGLPLKRNGLERIKQTQALFDLSLKQRQLEMKDAIALGPDFRSRRPPGPILLIDDIYTTGTTARSAVVALQKAGIQVYGLAAIATTRKK